MRRCSPGWSTSTSASPRRPASVIRRLDLAVGDRGETVAAWLDPADWQVKPLRQTYARVTATDYDHAAPLQDMRARIGVDGFGAVVDYPGLWRRE